MARITVARRIVRWDGQDSRARSETLAAEEPLEIRIAGRAVVVTMRTPGDDFDLVAGFLVGEGVVGSTGELVTMRACASDRDDPDDPDAGAYNVMDVALAPGVRLPQWSIERSVYTSSSCGVCGKASIDAVRLASRWHVADDPLKLAPEVLYRLPETLRDSQRIFERTGGLHAAGLFDSSGRLLCLREDVGRHNAVDKVVGWALRGGLLPLRGHVLMVSGRASFELVQKASLAGIPMLAAVSAPSSLAVRLATEAGVTLAAFLRGTSVNIYSRDDRIG